MAPRSQVRGLIALVVGVAAVGVPVGCGSGSTTGRPAAATAGPIIGSGGFGTVRVQVRTASGALAWCLLLADTLAQRERGLMEATDSGLNGFPGMLFRFPDDSTVGFYMRDTPLPLSIAYVGSRGQVVSISDMAPCPNRDGCPTYPAAGPYRFAIEVPQGRLPDLGITSDAGVAITDTGASC